MNFNRCTYHRPSEFIYRLNHEVCFLSALLRGLCASALMEPRSVKSPNRPS